MTTTTKDLRTETNARERRKNSLATSAPAVSVVIPAYNVASFIGETLASVFAQTFTDYEVILVNDGSPDTEKLERAIAPWRERLNYFVQENGGPSRARNTAIQAARGTYVALLDGDDVWLPAFLETQMHCLSAEPELDLVYADAMLFGASPLAGENFMQRCPSVGEVTFESLVGFRCNVLTSCVVARRQTLIDAGLFDEAFRRSEDFDLWLRIAHRGGRIAYTREALAHHRLHPTSLAADESALFADQQEVWRKLDRTLPLTTERRELIQAQIAASTARYELAKGKRQLLDEDYDVAADHFARAYEANPSSKLRGVLFMIRAFPKILRALYLMRAAKPQRDAEVQEARVDA